MKVFVLIDALGWSYIEGRPFLNDLLPYRKPLRTVLGYSSGAIPTMLTGKRPAEHGHWNLFYYDPARSPFRWLRLFRFLPKPLLDHRVTRKLLKELGRRALGLGPLFDCSVSPSLLPFFDYVEKRNLYAPGGIRGARSAFDELAADGVPHHVYSYHDASDTEILDRAVRDIERGDAGFYFLYLSEIDGLLHLHCHEPEKIAERFDWYARRLRQVFEAARRRDPQARLTVFSDHGMAPVHASHDLVGEIESLGLTMPEQYLAVYDSTMARFWFFDPRARQAIETRLASIGYGRMLGDDELRALGVFFEDRRYGDLVFLLDPGCLIAASDFNGPGWRPSGMHGYHPDDRFSDGIFLADREPGVAVEGIADAYHCMRHDDS